MITQELVQRVEDKVVETYLRAEQIYGPQFELPKIVFGDMGVVAGRAHLKLNKIQFSPTLLVRHTDDFLGDTVPHEVAHLLAFKLFPLMKQGHGREWKSVMRALGLPDASRCHSYNVEGLKRKSKKWVYTCGCIGRFHFLGRKRHDKAMIHFNAYSCLKCKQYVKWTGEKKMA